MENIYLKNNYLWHSSYYGGWFYDFCIIWSTRAALNYLFHDTDENLIQVSDFFHLIIGY